MPGSSVTVRSISNAARQMRAQDALPAEQAQRTLEAMLTIAERLGTPRHIAIASSIRQAQLDTGVDLKPLLVGVAALENIPANDMMLEPSALERRLGFQSSERAGHMLNRFLCQIGWQRSLGTGAGYEPTAQGALYAQSNHWVRDHKDGYNYKWNVEAVRQELARRHLLPRGA
jgi:hypothetical protein